MKNKCAVLLKAEMLHFMGFNEMRYGKDKRTRNRLIMVAAGMGLVAVMGVFYSAMLAVSFALLHMEALIPAYMLTIVSIITIIFNVVKAGNVLFQSRDFEMLLSLPVSVKSIISAKFLSMYILSMGFSLLFCLPMGIIYLITSHGGVVRIFMLITSFAIVPLFPMTIAMGLGAAITAISSRTKHKNVITILSYCILLGIYFFAMSKAGNLSKFSGTDFINLADLIGRQLKTMYPPAGIYHMAIHEESIGAYLLFVLGSAGVFLFVVQVISKGYLKIYSALNAHGTKSNYQWKENKETSVMAALFKKEWKRYTASGIYIMNTAIGAVFLVAVGIGLFITTPRELSSMIEIPQFVGVLERLIPMIACMFVLMTPVTASSISIEGKQWWIIQSLPVEAKKVYQCKIMVNLVLLIPAIGIYGTLCAAKYVSSFPGLILLYLMPASFAFFVSVAGLYINVKMPVFDWASETAVVKQGGSMMITMFMGIGTAIAGLIIIGFMPSFLVLWAELFITVLVSFITYFLYNKLCRIPLKEIG